MSSSSYLKLAGAATLGVIGLRFIWRRLSGGDTSTDSTQMNGSPKAATTKSSEDEQAKEEGVWIYFGSQSDILIQFMQFESIVNLICFTILS